MLRTLFLLGLVSVASVGAEPKWEYIRLSQGVGGSIAPKPIQFQLLVVGTRQGPYDVYYKKLLDSKSTYRYQCWHTTMKSLDAVQADLEKMGTFQLPQVAAAEMDDIYRQEIGLEICSSRFTWKHAPPVGCIRTHSPIQANESQRQLFQKSVARVRQLASGGTECPPEQMDKAQQQLYATP